LVFSKLGDALYPKGRAKRTRKPTRHGKEFAPALHVGIRQKNGGGSYMAPQFQGKDGNVEGMESKKMELGEKSRV